MSYNTKSSGHQGFIPDISKEGNRDLDIPGPMDYRPQPQQLKPKPQRISPVKVDPSPWIYTPTPTPTPT